MYKILLFCLMIWSVSVPAAETKTTAIGVGSDENAALADALAKAVAQVNGVRSTMDISTSREVTTSQATTNDNGQVKEERARQERGDAGGSRLQASGSVSRYSILSSEGLPDGRTRVTVEAFVYRHVAPTYRAPGSSTAKRRVAVFPAVVDGGSYDYYGRLSSNDLGVMLTGAIERTALRDGRLSVLDRSTLGASLVELGLVGSSLTGPAERAKLRQFRGADIIVLPNLLQARFVDTSRRLTTTGQMRYSFESTLEVEVRGIVPATGELLLVEKYTILDADSRDAAIESIAERVISDVARRMN